MAAKKRTARGARVVRTPIGGRRKPDPKATAKTEARRVANLSAQHAAHLRKIAMAYPETVEDFPWGHPAYKVRKKVFLTLVVDDDGLRMSMKLPESRYEALLLPFTEPTHYGLGKHGWVSSKFGPGDDVPIDLIEEWIEESFRAVAPKKVVTLLEETAG